MPSMNLSLRKPRPVSTTSESIRLVVTELGSAMASVDDSDETIVLAQHQEEQPLAFAQRVLNKLATLERGGRRLNSAIVLAGRHDDRAAKAARRLIVLSLSAQARAHRGLSLLTLVSNDEAGGHCSASLLELTEELVALPHAESVSVRVCFGARPLRRQRRPSGVYRVSGGHR